MSETAFESSYQKALTAAGLTELAPGNVVRCGRSGRDLIRISNVGPKNIKGQFVEPPSLAGMPVTVAKDTVVEIVSSATLAKPTLRKEHALLVREIYKHTHPDFRIKRNNRHEVRDQRHRQTLGEFNRPNVVLETLSEDELRAYAATAGILIGAKGHTAQLPPDEKLRRIREIVSAHQANKIEGFNLDATTAQAIVAVHDAMTPPNQTKFLAMKIPSMAAIAFRLIK